MHRFVVILILFCLPAALIAGDLVRYSGPDASFQARVEWVRKAANKEKSYWIGYSVQRLMYPQETYISGVSIHGLFKDKKPTLQEWIYGVRTPQHTDVKEAARAELDRSEKQSKSKIWKEIGIFQQFKKGSTIPSQTQVMNLTIASKFDGPVQFLRKRR